jgi:hypothetical protein
MKPGEMPLALNHASIFSNFTIAFLSHFAKNFSGSFFGGHDKNVSPCDDAGKLACASAKERRTPIRRRPWSANA